MDRAELASLLVQADEEGRARLFDAHAGAADLRLAYLLKDVCLEGWSSEPVRAQGAAAALRALAERVGDGETAALAEWCGAIGALVEGRMEAALALLDAAEARLRGLGRPDVAASTQISKLIALAMLGRYDEAVECGLRAREVLDAHGDLSSAAKIEQNIGGIYLRRDRYREAEQFLEQARRRYRALGDQLLLARAENGLALAHTLQHNFRAAEELYTQALARAEASDLAVTQAEIEASMGNLMLFQGRYDRALDYLERSRRRYASLGMSHQSAVAELELADAYLELNLAPEAASVYERVIPVFAELGMRAEQARALARLGRALLLTERSAEAHRRLAEARELYAAEGNYVGEASVTLTEAQLHHAEGDHRAAGLAAAQAEIPLSQAGAWGRLLLARWLRGEAARAEGHERLARLLLEDTLSDSVNQTLPQISERCHTSLGLLAAGAGRFDEAEESFKRAVSLVETLRAPLPAEELRTAFVSDKLAPYDGLVRLCLSDEGGRPARVEEALCYVERARSRALVEMMSGAFDVRPRPRDPFEAELTEQLETLREELNWLYNRINRPLEAEGARGAGAQSSRAMEALHEAVREREARASEIMRQLQLRRADGAGGALPYRVETLDPAALRRDLGAETALVEYAALDGELLAFVVNQSGVEVVRRLGAESSAEELLAAFRFQIDALRHGAGGVRAHLPALAERARRHLAHLYDLLLRPLESRLEGARRLVVVPHRALHYVPFHALHDGASYVLERREVSYAPSAAVLRYCLGGDEAAYDSALLAGLADEHIPRVRDEVRALAPLFPSHVALLDDEATLAALREHAPQADVLHLACHGQFRPDNPLFSSLRLADGWLTVRDAYGLSLRGGLVTLSACETGMSAVAPGDELLGLVRGFFSAGARSLVLSLWTVDDEATARTMTDFYTALRAGQRPAAALRSAQLKLLADSPHPFFWSPFVLVGRW